MVAAIYTNDWSWVLPLLGLLILWGMVQAATREARKGHGGWLYFIGGRSGPIKVGITRGLPEDRCSDLQTGNPVRLQVLYALRVNDPEEAEGRAHNALEEHHVGGEWYGRQAALSLMRQIQNGPVQRGHLQLVQDVEEEGDTDGRTDGPEGDQHRMGG